MIERALRDLESQKKKLEVSVYEQNPMIEQYILYGLLNEQRMDEKEERYINMVRQFANFRVMVLNDGSDAEPYIDEIDKVLARHYNLTEEELDFIINYDIKYRMKGEQ